MKELNAWLDAGKKECLIVKGARQVGKSYIVNEVLTSRFSHVVTVDFRLNPELCGIFDGDLGVDSLITKMKISLPAAVFEPGQTAIFLDEIQACPPARTALKSFALDGRYTVVASGSLLGLDYSTVPSYPVGYEHEVLLRSLDFEEFLWALGLTQDSIDYLRECIASRRPLEEFVLNRIDEYYRIYLAVGGMPEAVKSYLKHRDVAEARVTQRDIVTGYRNDIGKYSKARERNKIFACFDSIPTQLSKESKKFKYAQIGDQKSPSARKYRSSLDWIANAGIGTLCTNLTEPKLPLEERSEGDDFKLYLNDTGLLLSMMDDDVARAVIKGDVRVNRGALVENATAEGLAKCGFPLHYFAAKNLEIDFIVALHGTVTAIEVKSGNNQRAKSLNSVKEKYGVKRRIKFEQTNIEVSADGIEHYPLFTCAFADALSPAVSLQTGADEAAAVNEAVKKLRTRPADGQN